MNESQAMDINRIAAAVARELTPKNGGPAPIIKVGDAQELGAINGSIDIAIVIGDKTYTLTLETPSDKNGNEYVFKLTMERNGQPAETLGSFQFKDKDDWAVSLKVPQFSIGPVTVKMIDVSVGQGTVQPVAI